MKVGGQILWNVTPICETSQIYYLMGRRLVKDVLGNHLNDPLFLFGSLVEYHPITAKDQSHLMKSGSECPLTDIQMLKKQCREKLEKIPTWQLRKVRNKKEVIDEARIKGNNCTLRH